MLLQGRFLSHASKKGRKLKNQLTLGPFRNAGAALGQVAPAYLE
jgi:hypothetical protein